MFRLALCCIVPLVLLCSPLVAQAPRPHPIPAISPAAVGMDAERLKGIDRAVNDAIRRGDLPGAVVLILRQGRVVFRKAYGDRSKHPEQAAMTLDTIFDLASLTKPIVTAACIMLLLERGELRLTDPVSRHLPAFDEKRKHQITVEQLLLHTSGLIPDNPLKDYRAGREQAVKNVLRLEPIVPPGSKFMYSDVNYILLGMIVEKIAGEGLDDFARKNLFAPLGMKDTTFKPGPDLAQRCAPTEQRSGKWMQGEVHDPRAFYLGGVAGHAGLFSTADDLAVYCQMLLNGGDFGGKRIFAPTTVRLMTAPRAVPGGRRTLGWDADTAYSSNRGELFPVGGFGHTGFTGTSIWVDPGSQTVVILLSNRVHPNGKGNVVRLRNQVATIVAASIVKAPFPQARAGEDPPEKTHRTDAAHADGVVLTGIDVLQRDGFGRLKGRRVGLVTNHTGIDRDGNSTIDLLHAAPGVKLVALFSPEHGIRGQFDKLVADDTDEKTGLPVYSLYGKRKRPSAEQLKGIDTLVFDIQDIGCRFYTYISTLGYVLETAAEHRVKVIVLDRPNPIGGVAVDGPVLEKEFESFVGYHPIPVRHGMTAGELAQLFNKERQIGADLEVVRVEGWKRDMFFDRTGLLWVNPSPNMRSLTEALLYPGIGLLETTNVSVGRGTDRPFEIVGAPWINGQRLAASLAKHKLPGVRFVPVRFTPSASTHAGKRCGGLHILVDDWKLFSPLDTGLAIACELRRLYPREWDSERYVRLLAHRPTLAAIQRDATPAEVRRLWQRDLEGFRKLREKYLLY